MKEAIVRVRGTTFNATAATPGRGLRVSTAQVGLELEDCTWDGSTFGWSANACDLSGVQTDCRILRPVLRNGSDLSWATGGKLWVSGEDIGLNCHVNGTF